MDLPPLSEAVINASIQNRPSSMVWGILEPKGDLQHNLFDGLLVGRALVDAGTESITVRVMNLTRLPKRIKEGTQISTCSVVESVLVEKAMVSCEGSNKKIL